MTRLVAVIYLDAWHMPNTLRKILKVIFIIRTTPKHLKNIISKNSFDFIELDINPENYSKSIEKIELLALEKF